MGKLDFMRNDQLFVAAASYLLGRVDNPSRSHKQWLHLYQQSLFKLFSSEFIFAKDYIRVFTRVWPRIDSSLDLKCAEFLTIIMHQWVAELNSKPNEFLRFNSFVPICWMMRSHYRWANNGVVQSDVLDEFIRSFWKLVEQSKSFGKRVESSNTLSLEGWFNALPFLFCYATESFSSSAPLSTPLSSSSSSSSSSPSRIEECWRYFNACVQQLYTGLDKKFDQYEGFLKGCLKNLPGSVQDHANRIVDARKLRNIEVHWTVG